MLRELAISGLRFTVESHGITVSDFDDACDLIEEYLYALEPADLERLHAGNMWHDGGFVSGEAVMALNRMARSACATAIKNWRDRHDGWITINAR